MRVKVRQSHRYQTVVAFSGKEYNKKEFRDVPEGCEEEAKRHPYLEIEATVGVSEGTPAVVVVEETILTGVAQEEQIPSATEVVETFQRRGKKSEK